MGLAKFHPLVSLALSATLFILGPAVPAATPVRGPDLNGIRAAVERIRPLHSRLGKPKPGEWLAQHQEPGQTFDEYRACKPNRPDAQRKTMYIQPLGEFTATQQRIVNETADLLARFYGHPVRQLDPLGSSIVPETARRVHPSWGDKQILTTYVLDEVLKPRRPKDAIAVLALTASDLWPGKGWNFVFGQASLTDRVGVWSLYRNGDPDTGEADYTLCLRRTLKTATHETGHMLGMLHCTAYTCGMNGSNHRAESDSRPLDFCPECVQKLWWACGTDPVKRCESLREFAQQHKLEEEAEFWKQCIERLRGR